MKKIADILSEYQELMQYLWGSGVSSSRQETPQQAPQAYQPQAYNRQLTYQSPLRGPAKNLGAYAPGVPSPGHAAGHFGIDLQQPKGSPVYPIGPGTVGKTGVDNKGGNYVTTLHDNGNVRVYYAHLDSILVRPGQTVDYNTVIGTVGNSGNARQTSPHLHYEVRVKGERVNPAALVGQPIGATDKVARRISLLRKMAVETGQQ